MARSHTSSFGDLKLNVPFVFYQVMKEFINDDNDHSFSVTSLSVQLFTVPSIAQHLIANHDIFATLIRTFQSECERKKNDQVNKKFPAETRRHLNLIRESCSLRETMELQPSDGQISF